MMTPPSSSSSRRSKTVVDKSVGGFSIDDEIGRGSFATVFRGQQKNTGSLVAIKSVNLSKLNKKLRDNLYTEIEILKGLHHPHAVALIDFRESNSHIHLVLEYCELGDLSYFIKKREKLGDHEALRDMVRRYPMPVNGGLPEVIVRHFLKQLASAMEFLRARNFIHRDVKPQNLLILPSPEYLSSARGRPIAMKGSSSSFVPMVGLTSLPMLKIADFGFARSLPSASLAETLCGSPLYMAPEILRFEKYDGKADLWSVGTVLFEMITAKPPFRAANHVELLRKIEQSDDHIRFPKDVMISSHMKDLIKTLLKRTPSARLGFENFFGHPAIVESIPGLVEDDCHKEVFVYINSAGKMLSRKTVTKNEHYQSPNVIGSPRSSPPREKISAYGSKIPITDSEAFASRSPHRPTIQTRIGSKEHRKPLVISPKTSHDMGAKDRDQAPNFTCTPKKDGPSKLKITDEVDGGEAFAEAEQAVRDAREYVLVEKRAVEVNAFADEMAANPRLQGTKQPLTPISGAMARRATTQGLTTSSSEALSSSIEIHPTHEKSGPEGPHKRQNSVGKSSGSPSVTSAISRALNSASLRVFGVSYPDMKNKSVSPYLHHHHSYSSYPMTLSSIVSLGDGRLNRTQDDDLKCLTEIEESATRSDVVYGFAEVKYKQLIPLAPSMDQRFGGPNSCKDGLLAEDEDLTVEAIVSLSEEALVLYIKALSLLAKSMDIARAWWNRKSQLEVMHGHRYNIRSGSPFISLSGSRINHTVQWVRNRFNEVFEKAELISLKLLDAQNQLPEDHPAHLNPAHGNPAGLGATNVNRNIILTSGVTAEKLMYDRAIDMSRSAAISELANEDIDACERSYITAIRMLEAVLEDDQETRGSHIKPSRDMKEDTTAEKQDSLMNGIDLADQQAVLKVISMIKIRLSNLHRKKNLIAMHSLQVPTDKPALNDADMRSIKPAKTDD